MANVSTLEKKLLKRREGIMIIGGSGWKSTRLGKVLMQIEILCTPELIVVQEVIFKSLLKSAIFSSPFEILKYMWRFLFECSDIQPDTRSFEK